MHFVKRLPPPNLGATVDCHLYVDESGDFKDTSSDAAERATTHVRRGRGASLVAGVVSVGGELSEEKARALLVPAIREAGEEVPDWFHGNRLSPSARLRISESLLRRLKADGLQPVRLVNVERVSWGNRAANYLNMVAELLLRLSEHFRRIGYPRLNWHLHYARWVYEAADGGREVLTPEEYERKIREYFAIAGVRAGCGGRMASWNLVSVTPASARRERALQICDLLSNASYHEVIASGRGSSASPADGVVGCACGEWGFTLQIRALDERVHECLCNGASGIGAVLVAQAGFGENDENENALLNMIIENMASIDGAALELQLKEITNWLEVMTDHVRNAPLARRIGTWFLERLLTPLTRILNGRDEALIEVSRFRIQRLLLTTCNHCGDLVGASLHASELRRSLPAVASRWDAMDSVLTALVHIAVHQTDARQLDEAAENMRAVDSFLGGVSSLLSTAYPGVFPEAVSATLRGQALGTWLQAEMAAGLLDRRRLKQARALNEQAMAEFATVTDRGRQCQYRCQIETYDGAFAEARAWLQASLSASSSDCAALAETIGSLRGASQGFALLHWARIGACAALVGDEQEAKQFAEAYRGVGLCRSEWVRMAREYPAHGILRQVALLYAARGQHSEATRACDRLRAITPAAERAPVLNVLFAATLAAVACQALRENRNVAIRLLDDERPSHPGAAQLVAVLMSTTFASMAKFRETIAAWQEPIQKILESGHAAAGAASTLASLAAQIPY